MTASEPTASLPLATADDAESPDSSCRWPLFVLFIGAAAWGTLASVFQLIASIKFHSSGFLADCPWTTYGRIHDAAGGAFLYGFAIQAGLGIALRICSGKAILTIPRQSLVILGGALWNLGVLAGVIGILGGDSTGYENFQMPYYAAMLLFLGYLVAGVTIVLMLHGRRQPFLSPPQWFVLAALFWFAWILTTAVGLLLISPVRGVEQSVIDWWYSGNLTVVWLGLMGLGTGLYFLEQGKAPGSVRDFRPLFVFWTLILFGSWTGIPDSAPVPAWMPALSRMAAWLLAIPALTVAVMIFGRPSWMRLTSGSVDQGTLIGSCFIGFGIAAWVAATGLKIVCSLPQAGSLLEFTWFVNAQSELNTYGFYAMVLFGAIYWMMPQIAGHDWPLQKAVRAHLWLAAIGVLLIVIPLAIAGIVQGLKLSQPAIPFVDLTLSILPYLRVSTLGDVLILMGHLLFLLNLILMAVGVLCAWGRPRYRAVMMEPGSVEVGQ